MSILQCDMRNTSHRESLDEDPGLSCPGTPQSSWGIPGMPSGGQSHLHDTHKKNNGDAKGYAAGGKNSGQDMKIWRLLMWRCEYLVHHSGRLLIGNVVVFYYNHIAILLVCIT